MSALLLEHCQWSRIKLSEKVQADAERAETCFSQGLIQVLMPDKQLVPARTAWEQAGVGQDDIDTLLTPEGQWHYFLTYHQLDALFDLPVEQFQTEVMKFVAPLYEPVQPHLNATARFPKHGFNDHRFATHATDVIQNTREVLRLAGVADESMEMKLSIFAAANHDEGNGFSRLVHSHICEHILQLITKDQNLTETKLVLAILATATHDESVAMPLLAAVLDKCHQESDSADGEEIDNQRFMELYSRVNSRISSALRIADKVLAAHFTRTFNTRDLELQALHDDNHFLVSSCFGFERIILPQPDTVRIAFNFSLTREELLNVHQQWSRPRTLGHGQRLHLPTQRLAQIQPELPETHYFSQLLALFWEIHFDRMTLLVTDCFRVFEQASNVEIIFTDIDVLYRQYMHAQKKIKYTFNRDNFLTALQAVQELSLVQKEAIYA